MVELKTIIMIALMAALHLGMRIGAIPPRASDG
jgi:hypothetical protein